MKNSVAILTGGGPAPGMNTVMPHRATILDGKISRKLNKIFMAYMAMVHIPGIRMFPALCSIPAEYPFN